jgi:hypothetical protein
MISTEQTIKQQYAKVFRKTDWSFFKRIAEYYFKRAATLRKKDIDIDEVFKLNMRNIQKRLFLGIACELLVKSCYLKHGYVINKPIDKSKGTLINFSNIKISELDVNDTFTLNPLINYLNHVIVLADWPTVERGLKILKVFRNKEGHVAVMWHKYDVTNYRDIEASVIQLYQDAFNEQIDFKISIGKADKGVFKIIK